MKPGQVLSAGCSNEGDEKSYNLFPTPSPSETATVLQQNNSISNNCTLRVCNKTEMHFETWKFTEKLRTQYVPSTLFADAATPNQLQEHKVLSKSLENTGPWAC